MIIIGEKINATIPRIKKAVMERDGAALGDLAAEQEKAGAGYIDVNVGTGEGRSEDEVESMEWLVGVLKERVGAALCIDSADPAVLEAGLRAAGERAGLLNSVKAVDEAIAGIMPLAAMSGVSVIGLAVDENGIPKDVEGRLKACGKIAAAAESHKVPLERVYFDPVCMPVSTDVAQGKVTIETLAELGKRFPQARTVLAASNVSYGLPYRSLVNRAMIQMAMACGVDALLVNPLDVELMAAVTAAEVVLGRDRHCRRYLRAHRQGMLRKESQ